MDKINCFEPHDQKDQEVAAELKKEFGDYNDFPPNWRRITADEFAKSNFFHYGPRYMGHRQMCRPAEHMTDGHMLEATLFFFDDHTGVAMESYRPLRTDFTKPAPEAEVRFYAFGCDHQYREMSMDECRTEGLMHHGHCWHVFLCEKCGQTKAHDSSD